MGTSRQKAMQKSMCVMHGEGRKGPGPVLRALGTNTHTRVELQHLLQIPVFFVACVNLTEKPQGS